MAVVLDASALLAYWLDEPGADAVEAAIEGEGAVMASVNLAEVLAKLDDLRAGFSDALADPPPRSPAETTLTPLGGQVPRGAVVIEPFTTADAVVSSKLRSITKTAGLSLGDRVCLALARRMNLETVTADRAWEQVGAAIGVRVQVIR